jgi:hypothetical protein
LRKRQAGDAVCFSANMFSEPTTQFQDCQRIQVIKETNGTDKTVKISVERYDAILGWYSAGALRIPLHQLPLLQQSLEEMNCANCAECPPQQCRGKIISFPLMLSEPESDVVGN